jgi:hypothetical protein
VVKIFAFLELKQNLAFFKGPYSSNIKIKKNPGILLKILSIPGK